MPDHPLEPEEYAELRRVLFGDREPAADPSPPDPATGNVVRAEGANPSPAPDPDQDVRQFVRDLFTP